MLAQSPPNFDSFEVATIKITPSDWRGSRYLRMQTAHQFEARNHSVKTLVAAAFNLNLRAISGGPQWAESDHFDILAKSPGDVRPNLEEQMAMLRKLLAERFQFRFHREEKELSIYELTVAKGGPKLKESTLTADATPEGPPPLIFVISPELVRLPGRDATMAEVAWVFQRAALDRPVIDKTGLDKRYDFDLEWAPDASQFGGVLGSGPVDSAKPGLFTAMQEQLGLKLEAKRGPVATLVIDRVERPSEN
jgi:uncharacterized protein (TIGR03435 family)